MNSEFLFLIFANIKQTYNEKIHNYIVRSTMLFSLGPHSSPKTGPFCRAFHRRRRPGADGSQLAAGFASGRTCCGFIGHLLPTFSSDGIMVVDTRVSVSLLHLISYCGLHYGFLSGPVHMFCDPESLSLVRAMLRRSVRFASSFTVDAGKVLCPPLCQCSLSQSPVSWHLGHRDLKSRQG